MLGFLKPKLRVSDPVEFRDEIEIGRPAEQVYGLIDWADPRNALRQRGNRIEPVGAAADHFQMSLETLPGQLFEMIVTKAAPNTHYAFATIAMPRIGRMVRSHESYELKELGPEWCRVQLVNTVSFVPMRSAEFGQEQLMVFAACHNALAKLKIQAEQGVDAVSAVADKWIV